MGLCTSMDFIGSVILIVPLYPASFSQRIMLRFIHIVASIYSSFSLLCSVPVHEYIFVYSVNESVGQLQF